MKRLSLALITLGCLATTSLFAQEYNPPVDPALETKEDYVKYEPDFIKAAKWLESTPLNTEKVKRTITGIFVMKWLTGSPTVSLEIQPLVTKLSDKNDDLLMVFMAGYARWVLENNYDKDVLKGYEAGVKSMINAYSLGGDVKKNKTLLKAIEADKAGTLTDWIKENYSKK